MSDAERKAEYAKTEAHFYVNPPERHKRWSYKNEPGEADDARTVDNAVNGLGRGREASVDFRASADESGNKMGVRKSQGRARTD
jgi:hypothetical protein